MITRDAVEAAGRRIAPHVLRTPLVRSSWLSAAARADVWLKLETLQPTHSFKIRGALNAVLRLGDRPRAPLALVTASAGNHGRALAQAARTAGIPLTVYVPEHAPAVKRRAIEEAGATLVLCPDYDAAEQGAKAHGRRGDAEYVSPYSHDDVIAGAGTIGLEILGDEPSIDAIVVPIGGGGLASGVAIAAGDRAATFGVEAEASRPFTSSLAAGRIVTIDVQPTLADGLAGNLDPDSVTFDIVRRFVTGIACVGETEIRDAMAALIAEERLIAEAAAAVGVAGVMSQRLPLEGRRVAVVLSGANVDPETVRQLLN